MGTVRQIRRSTPITFLGKLRRDVRGNTIALIAAALFPLLGLVGGGVDLARLYMTKTRLQHACDAGALAGRKAMGGGTWSQDSYKPRTIANQFFNGNFGTGSYGSTSSTPTFSESGGKVTGAASAQLPMMLMQVFGIGDQTVSVTCDAEMRLPNTDVMFVLDTTGSMGYPAPGGGGTKMDALQSAVKCFYESVARLNTSENCANGNSTSGTSPEIQVRFGFVPFATNVNVGRLLPSNWFADDWSYQSRAPAQIYGVFVSFESSGGDKNVSGWSGWTNTLRSATTTNSNCNGTLTASPGTVTANGDPYWPDEDSQTASAANATAPTNWTGYAPYLEKDYQVTKSGSVCQEQVRQRTLDKNVNWRGDGINALTPGAKKFPAWSYKQTSLNIRGLKSGTGWNTSFTLPIGDNYSNQTITWDGCIEERSTVKQASYQPIPPEAWDLNIKDAPDSRAKTQWGPVLPDVLHMRRTAGWSNSKGAYRFRGSDGSMTTTPMTTFTQGYYDGKSYTCAVPARKMAVWNDANAFENYVDTLRPGGNTYHDIGLLWGARLLWPDGLFRTENEFTPKGGDIQRNLIFMTDGDACTNSINYQAYGLAWYDRRTISDTADPGTGQSCSHDSPSELTQQVDARTSALCTAVKNKGIALWVIYFPDAGADYPDVEARFRTCADTGRFFPVRTSTSLKQAFADIAAQISQLRLTN